MLNIWLILHLRLLRKNWAKLPSIRVLGGNYSSIEQVNSIQQLLAYCLITGTDEARFGYLPAILSNSNFTKDPSKVIDIELIAHMIVVNNQRDSVSPLPLSAKPKKGKSQTVTPTLPKSQGPEASGALSKKSKKPKSKKTPAETKETSTPKPTEGSEQSHSVSSGTVPDPQYLERNIQLASTGLPSTLDEGTVNHNLCLRVQLLILKTQWEINNPLIWDCLPRLLMKARLKPRRFLKGLLGDKDSGGNKPPADMEPIHPTVVDPSSTRELDTSPLVLSTYADVRAFLLSDDEAQESEKDILRAGEEMDEDPQAASIAETHHRSHPPQADKPQSSHAPSTEALDTDSSCDDILKKYNNTLPLTECQLATVNYTNLKASVDEYYDENIAHRDQTDKLVEASMSSLDKSSNTISDLYKGFNIITKELLKEIKKAVKDDSVNKKISEATESFS
ncbi:hypothetical protein Tco_1479586, partial [Tanacetum coccineum]